MTAQETNLLNAFETTLTAQMNPNDLTATVASTSTLASPAYLVIEPEVAARREYVLFDGAFIATAFTSTNINKRYLTGSAAASGLTHPVGSVVRMAPVAQHFEDINDRVDALDHGTSLAGLADDDHTQYSRADGTRAFTGVVAGVTPTLAAHLATKQYVDSSLPVGTGAIFFGAAAPNASWLLCQGQVVAQATYPDLYAIVGTLYNTGGEGAGNFRLPDLRQRFPLGKAAAGTGSTLGGTGGTIDHAHTQPQHQHGWTGLTIADHAAHLHEVPIHGHLNTIGVNDHATHLHLVPLHAHANTIGVNAHAAHTHDTNIAHEHWFEDTFSTSYISGAAFNNGTGGSVYRTNGHDHTGSVGGYTSNGPASVTSGNPSASLTHVVTGGVTDAAAFNTELNAAAQTHTVTGGVTDKAAFNTENAAAMAHTIGGSVALGGDDATGTANPPFLTVNFIIKAL